MDITRRNSQSEVALVAHGEVATIEHAELPKGSVITTSGRVSGVTEPGELSVHYPFPIEDLVAIDDRGASTASDMERRSRQVAAALANSGVGPGDQVAVMCRNSRHFLTTIVALAKLGADILYLNA